MCWRGCRGYGRRRVGSKGLEVVDRWSPRMGFLLVHLMFST